MANTFKNNFQKAVGQVPTTIYTAATGVQVTVIGLTVSNITTSDVNVDVFVNSGGNDFYIVKGATIEPGSALVPIGGDQKLVLEQSNFIRVQSDTTSSVDVTISVLEIS